jgi:hypothetical protein
MDSISTQNVARFQAAYEETGITVYVWDAYRFCRANDLPVPPWVLRYFDQSAEKISGLVARDGPRRLPQQARCIGIALGFGGARGRPNLYEQMKRHERAGAIVRDVQQLVGQRWPLYAAYSEVATRFNLSISTINRIWLAAQQTTSGLGKSKRRNHPS